MDDSRGVTSASQFDSHPSAQNASIGSARRLRRAGPIVASSPTAVITPATPSARPAVRSNPSPAAANRAAGNSNPTSNPVATWPIAPPKMPNRKAARVGAECLPDADLTRALRHRERHQRVDAGRRQQQDRHCQQPHTQASRRALHGRTPSAARRAAPATTGRRGQRSSDVVAFGTGRDDDWQPDRMRSLGYRRGDRSILSRG